MFLLIPEDRTDIRLGLVLCNNKRSQNYSCADTCSDHTIPKIKNSCINIKSVLSMANFSEQPDTETRNILLNNSIDPGTSKTCPYYCNVFMPNINDTCEASKNKYTSEEPTGKYVEMDETCSTVCLKDRSQGAHNMFSNESLLFSSIKRECNDNINYVKRPNFSQVVDDKKFADKTTFCRPMLNTYNHECIYKTIERNCELQTRIRKLADVQEKEKQREAWNNYINKLKNKHRCRTFTRNTNPGIINRQKKIDALTDYLNSRFMSNESRHCRHLLQGIYAPQNDSQPCYDYPSSVHLEQYNNIPSLLRNNSRYIFENNPLNFLTSSQGRLLMLQQERLTNGLCNLYPVPQSTCSHSKKICVPKKRVKREDRHNTERNLYKKCQPEQRRNYYTDEYKECESRIEKQKEQYLREVEEHLRKGAELETKLLLLKKRENKQLHKSNTEEPVEKKFELKGQDNDQDTKNVDSTEEEQRVDNNETDSEDENLKARYNRISDKVAKLKQNMSEVCSTRPNSSLEIERKLDNLIDTVHSLIEQFKMNNNCILNQPNKNECGLTTCMSTKLLGKFLTNETKQASKTNSKVRSSFKTSGTSMSNIDNNQPNSTSSYKDNDQTNSSGILELYNNKEVSVNRNSKRYSDNDQTIKTSENPNSNIQIKDFNDYENNQTILSHINSKIYSVNDQTNKTSESPNSNIQTKDYNDFENNQTVSSLINFEKFSVGVQTDKTSLITNSSDSNNQIENFHDERMKVFNKYQISKDKLNIDERQDSKQNSLIEEVTTSLCCCNTDLVDIKEDDSKKREREEKEEEKRQKKKNEREQRVKGQKDCCKENDSTRMPPNFGGDPDIRMLTVGSQNRHSSRRFAVCFEPLFRPDVEKLENNYSTAKSDKAVCNMSTEAIIKCSERYQQSKFNRILTEEIDKSNRARRDIQNMLNDKLSYPCKFQLTFDVPTKERSTEVTASLSKTKLSYHNKIENSKSIDYERKTLMNELSSHQSVTIAVNTDPLSLLTLLRISTETIGRLLSGVNFDYYSYLSMIQFPQLSREMGFASNPISQYVCNICGAAFMRASQLNDHIQGHGLGSTRDCCVCRHLLNVGHPAGRFSCPYCGHCFTRAYCCELHQQSCAKRLGTVHDGDKSLSIL